MNLDQSLLTIKNAYEIVKTSLEYLNLSLSIFIIAGIWSVAQ